MTDLSIWLLAVSLAMDCFTVSMTSGMILRKVYWRTWILMSFFFGLFQAIMPLIGWIFTSRFSHLIESIDHWIAFGLLSILGLRMIKEGFNDKDQHSFDPNSLKVIITLAIATSIDALAVGISFAFIGMDTFSSILYPIFIIGVVSLVFSMIGQFLGIYFGKRFHIRTEIIGGIILIGIGVKILADHLHLL